MIVSAPFLKHPILNINLHRIILHPLQYYSSQKAKTMDFQHLCQAKTIKKPLYEPKNRFQKL